MGCLLKASLSLRSLRKLGWGEWGALALGLVLNLYEPGRRLQAPQLWGSRLWLALPAFLCDERSQGVKGCGAQMLLPGHVEILLEKENDSKECGCPHTSQPWTQLTGQRRGLREGAPRQQCEGKRPAPGLLGAQRDTGRVLSSASCGVFPDARETLWNCTLTFPYRLGSEVRRWDSPFQVAHRGCGHTGFWAQMSEIRLWLWM